MVDSDAHASQAVALADGDEFEEYEDGEGLTVTLAVLLRAIWQRRRLVAAVVLCGIVLSLAYALLSPNIYTSRTSVMPPGNSSSYSNLMGMLGGSSSSLSAASFGLETPSELYVKILGSRNVQDGLIVHFGLMQYFRARKFDDARRALEDATKIDEDTKSGLITLAVSDTDAQMASNLANGYVEGLNRILAENSTSSAHRERIFLEERIKQVKKELDASSQALSQFSTKNKTIDLDTQARSMVDSGLRLQTDLIEARSDLAALRQMYTEDNARVKSGEARIAALESQLKQMGGFSKGSGSSAPSSGSSPYPSAAELPTLGMTYADLQRQVKVDEALWDSLTREYEAAKVEEAKSIATVTVLDLATVPQSKSAPTRWLIVVVGTFLSFLAGCTVVILLEKWNKMEADEEPKKLLVEAFGPVVAYASALIRRRKMPKSAEAV